jgi:NADPH-dependent glutamate synthase beta subunit-like oxidoreductase
MDVARTARRVGSEVTVIYRRTRAEMPAVADEVAEAETEGVSFRFLEVPLGIERTGTAFQVTCQAMRLGPPDESGRPRPEPIPGAITGLEVDDIVSAVGEDVDRSLLASHLPPGAIWSASEVPPVFLGGDLAGLRRTVADAIGSGRLAAAWIHGWLSLREPPVQPALPTPIPLEAMRLPWFDPVPRLHLRERPVASRLMDFGEVVAGLEERAARVEAGRCLSCGACTRCDRCWLACPDCAIVVGEGEYGVDLDHCKGCLLCVAECPRGAMVVETGADAASSRQGSSGSG